MSKSKDKRIKKFNRKRIWPSIVGLFLISVIMTGIVVATLTLYTVDLIDKKLYDSYDLSCKVADYMMSDRLSNISEEELDRFVDITDAIEGVAVLDSQNTLIWTNSDDVPDMNESLMYVDESGLYEDNFSLILQNDENGIFVKEGNNVRISDDIQGFFLEANTNIQLESLITDRRIPIINAKLWTVINCDGYNVMVLNNISVTNSDLIMVVLTLVLMILLIIVFMIYYISSIISVARSQKRITRILYTDMVTGGYNWLYFTKKGDKLLKKNHGRYNYAVVNLRMEKYRSFCTCFGVREGEELMEKFYIALKKCFNKNELMAHHDEADFGLLITHSGEEDLLYRLNKIEEVLHQVMPNIKLYFRFGICLADNNDHEVDSLYNNATTALALMPEESDEKIASYDIEMKKQQLWERKVEDDMDKALVTNQFKLYLQPKYSTKEEQLAGAEALVRWIHPVEGFIPPNKFIPIFENNGFILQLDDYMIEQVAMQQSKWLAEGRELFPISVNVSRAHFTREDLAEHICKIVDKYNVPHEFIELELTESAFFDDKYVLIDTVKQLRKYGFVVSMDDFGAGYSSLNSLKELSIDVLKIDADFFRGVDSVERGMLIVSKVIDLAKKLNMKIVAEGIESREQVDFLATQDCDLIQGYYFAKPMSIEEFEEKYN